jgi:SWIM zinc finger
MKPKQIKSLQAKSKKLVARVLKSGNLHECFVVLVGSNSTSTLNFIVTVQFNTDGGVAARCTCQWAEHGGIACSHVIAALSKLASSKKRALSFWLTSEEARRQKQALFHLSQDREYIWITSRAA